MNITPLRPHHIIDIVTQHGQNSQFKPHPYGHAVHTVAKNILNNINVAVKLIIEADEICQPCIHLLPSGQCDDILQKIDPPIPKQKYNDSIDSKLLSYLNIPPDSILTIKEYLESINSKIPGIEEICTHPKENMENRLEGLIEGLIRIGIRRK